MIILNACRARNVKKYQKEEIKNKSKEEQSEED